MLKGNVSEIIGQTPLVEIQSLSTLTGNQIFAKLEYLNPGGSIKDRTALGIILDAEKKGLLKNGDTLIEGTAGNTGIGIATIAAQRGYKCLIVMPNNQAQEKYQILKALGAHVIPVEPCPFSSEKHFYHTARKLAESTKNSYWVNQFENTANADFHYQTTGAEIWRQSQGQIDYFISAVGTGGTLAGVSCYLKDKNPLVHIQLCDPMGSGMFNYFTEGTIASHGGSITEGIGIMRLTENFKKAKIDSAVQITDQEMINMLYHIAKHDGLIIGTSAALNLAACYKLSQQIQNQQKNLVTIIGDSGLRYQSKIFNPDFLKEKSLNPLPLI